MANLEKKEEFQREKKPFPWGQVGAAVGIFISLGTIAFTFVAQNAKQEAAVAALQAKVELHKQEAETYTNQQHRIIVDRFNRYEKQQETKETRQNTQSIDFLNKLHIVDLKAESNRTEINVIQKSSSDRCIATGNC